jgi:regulatory protein
MAQLRATPDAGVAGVASWSMAEPKPAGPPPTKSRLHEAALAHLARYGTTQAGIVRVLNRRVDRWARLAGDPDPEIVGACRSAVREVADALVKAGVIDDAAFAESRARSLTRSGRSARAVAAHLGARGVDRVVVREAVGDDPEIQLAACVALTRRRRIGAFRRPENEADVPREMGMLARAGFEHEIARKALEMDPEMAEALVIRLKQA